MRILFQPTLWVRDTDHLQQLDRPLPCRFLIHAHVDEQRLHNLETDG